MNHPPLHELETLARRAIATVAASPARRRAMHEELLAHLHDCYEEELARLGGQHADAAIESAAHRLGHPADLRRQFQASVPHIERLFFQCLSGKEIPMTRLHWALALFAFFSGPAMMLPALVLHRDQGANWSSIAVPLALGLLITLGGLGTIAYGVIGRLRGRAA